MSNIINFTPKSHKDSEWTKTEPEHCTLIELCSNHFVKVFQLENDKGHVVLLAAFKVDDEWYVYQAGDTIITRHLFFFVFSYDYDATPEKAATNFFTGFFPS